MERIGFARRSTWAAAAAMGENAKKACKIMFSITSIKGNWIWLSKMTAIKLILLTTLLFTFVACAPPPKAPKEVSVKDPDSRLLAALLTDDDLQFDTAMARTWRWEKDLIVQGFHEPSQDNHFLIETAARYLMGRSTPNNSDYAFSHTLELYDARATNLVPSYANPRNDFDIAIGDYGLTTRKTCRLYADADYEIRSCVITVKYPHLVSELQVVVDEKTSIAELSLILEHLLHSLDERIE